MDGAFGFHPDNSGENNPMHGVHRYGENAPMHGKHHTEETRKKMSEAKSGENNPMYGKHHSEETRRKISEKKKGISLPPHTEEAKMKMSEQRRGENNPRALLSTEQVFEIIKLNNIGWSTQELATKFNVTSSCIKSILTGKTWSSITGIIYSPN